MPSQDGKQQPIRLFSTEQIITSQESPVIIMAHDSSHAIRTGCCNQVKKRRPILKFVRWNEEDRLEAGYCRAYLDTGTVAQTSKSAVSRVSKSANYMIRNALPTWKSAIPVSATLRRGRQQVWKPALRAGADVRMVAVSRCAPIARIYFHVF
jgi:hypothetical protein